MSIERIDISIAKPTELLEIGTLMAVVYSQLDGFPSEKEQPAYYKQFYELKELTDSSYVDVVVAKNDLDHIVGGVVYYSDMKDYGAGGKSTTSIQNAAGVRLLFVSPEAQGQGTGRKLTEYCINLAKQLGRSRVILHTTHFMPTAWGLYERMGFLRYSDIDFKQAELEVFGFQLTL